MAEKKALRDVYGEVLVELGEKDPRVVVLDADLSKSTKTEKFAKKFPDRFFEMGIQEQDMMGAAAGLASTGKIPFASTFAIFAAGRAWEQVRLSIAYARFNVKIVATHGGIATGEDGASHQMTEDFATMGSIPGMVVLSPSDATSTRAAIYAAYRYDGPVYVRLVRPKAPIIYSEPFEMEIGDVKKLRDGSDVAIIATGLLVHEALKAASMLEEKGISVKLYDFITVKPLNDDALRDAASVKYGIVTCEDHVVWGGLGANVAARLAELGVPKPMRFVALNDVFGRSGSTEALYRHYGLTGEHIARKALELVENG